MGELVVRTGELRRTLRNFYLRSHSPADLSESFTSLARACVGTNIAVKTRHFRGAHVLG